tara:strand:- start:236 stop:766 length:531 start_codon:yes stop_codon:yes gene_type:complete
MSPEDVDLIVSVAKGMPTKQNLPYYTVLYSLDRRFIERVHDLSIDPHNPRSIGRNTQTLAHMLVIYLDNWTDKKIKEQTRDDWRDNYNMSVGVSAGATSLFSNQLGYRTGFCQCYDTNSINKILKEEYGIEEKIKGTILGIGIPNNKYKRNSIVDKDNCYIRDVPTYIDETEVIKI